MSTFILKLIAIISMTIDHIGAAIGTDYINGTLYLSNIIPKNLYFLCRGIGRVAFPIYCYLIVYGYFHTRSIKKYALRLFIFGIISQLPFGLAFQKNAFDFSYINVYFTLLFGLICVYLADFSKKSYGTFKETRDNRYAGYSVLAYLGIVLIMVISIIINTDYSAYGVALILIFYYFKFDQPLSDKDNMKQFIKLFIAIAVLTIVFSNTVELLGLLALIPIAFHNNKKGPSMKYVFYAYYPVHLLVLYGVFVLLSK